MNKQMTDSEIVAERLSWNDEDEVVYANYKGKRVKTYTRGKVHLPNLEFLGQEIEFVVLQPFMVHNTRIENTKQFLDLAKEVWAKRERDEQEEKQRLKAEVKRRAELLRTLR